MAIVENRESIKKRLQSEAARQWGIDESDIKNGSFDPLVNLLFGALSVESEKVWHEMEVSRSHVVKRMVETVLPEVVTGIVPAHSVMMAKTSSESVTWAPVDQFYTSGNEPVYFSPAGTFNVNGANIQYIATGTGIDKIGSSFQREPMIRLTGEKSLAVQTCWIGIEPPANAETNELVLFINWASISDRAKFLPFTSSLKFSVASGNFSENVPLETSQGIKTTEKPANGPDWAHDYEKTVRDFYYHHFVTLDNLPFTDGRQLSKYPPEWELNLEIEEKALFYQPLLWIKIICPAAVTSDGLSRLEITNQCFPVINRKLIRQRGKLQPLFNVYALTDRSGFLGIHRVINGDGTELLPVNQKDLNKGQDVYALRNKNVGRFDHRDAFEKLTDVTAHMRDDLAAFNTLDNSILNNHLETINKGIIKLKEHLDSFEYELPLTYLMVRTRSQGSVLEVYFWASLGSKANGLTPQTRLNAESANQYKSETSVLMLPTSGGRDSLDESQMQKAFKEAILTRGRAVTIEDFRTIAKGILGNSVVGVEVKKGLNVGESTKEGVRRILEVIITPDASRKFSEEYWIEQTQLLKNTTEQRSTGVLPLYICVHGFNWRI